MREKVMVYRPKVRIKRKRGWFLRWIIGVFLFFVVVISGLFVYVRIVSKLEEPIIADISPIYHTRSSSGADFHTIGNNWLRKSESGLYEMYVEGAPFERGVIAGKLSRELLEYQEQVFVGQIRKLVPSPVYLGFLKYFVGWFNRDLAANVPEEYRQEIFGISQSATEDFNDIAMPYQRILNYHAAHDIGHALQNMSLVGCTSFATWGEKSEDGSLIIGRNFDFYVGEAFAENKIIAFYKPDLGHPFMMVTFGGMVGVLSGMNNQGLTVTINAAKSSIPTASATPVSIVAREVLQYASTIEEAYQIISSRKLFVAESFLIGSAKDGRAAVIEKNIDQADLYFSEEPYIISTNHFQSRGLAETELNQAHMQTSASVYRYDRVDELLGRNEKNSVTKTAAVLRDRLGLGNADIGLGNEKAINQLVSHHSIIFQPRQLKVWVSTAPWQLGKFVCYDLNTVFQTQRTDNREIHDPVLTIQPDPFLESRELADFHKFSKYRFIFDREGDISPDSLVKWNPKSYQPYMIAGDMCRDKGSYPQAIVFYQEGLKKEVATEHERLHMEKKLQHCINKLR